MAEARDGGEAREIGKQIPSGDPEVSISSYLLLAHRQTWRRYIRDFLLFRLA